MDMPPPAQVHAASVSEDSLSEGDQRKRPDPVLLELLVVLQEGDPHAAHKVDHGSLAADPM